MAGDTESHLCSSAVLHHRSRERPAELQEHSWGVNKTINNLQDRYTDLITERDQLQNKFNSFESEESGARDQNQRSHWWPVTEKLWLFESEESGVRKQSHISDWWIKESLWTRLVHICFCVFSAYIYPSIHFLSYSLKKEIQRISDPKI